MLGDCLDRLETLPDNSVDSIVTDPPYGLSFMGNKWDYDVPSIDVWKQCLRVLKPGGHLLSFSSARTYHRMTVNVEDAGFEIRDQIMWVYGSGFPKNHNLGEGKGTALKPAHEPIVLARKPISEKTIKDNVLKWGTGGLNIDKSRVPLNGELRTTPIHSDDEKDDKTLFGLHPTIQRHRETTDVGRYPSNFIHDGDQQVLDLFPQATTTKSKQPKGTDGIWSGESNTPCGPTYGDNGSAARFFYCAKANKKERNAGCDDLPEKQKVFNGQSGESSKDMKGVEKKFTTAPAKNNHPTVKPIKLMTYLVTLVTPAGGTTLDPFMGSGSTGIAAVESGYNFIGIEMNADYHSIATKRIPI